MFVVSLVSVLVISSPSFSTSGCGAVATSVRTFAHALILNICLEISSHNQDVCHSVIGLRRRHFDSSLYSLGCENLFSIRFKTVAFKLACAHIHLVGNVGHLGVSSCAIDTALHSCTWLGTTITHTRARRCITHRFLEKCALCQDH